MSPEHRRLRAKGSSVAEMNETEDRAQPELRRASQ